MSGMERGLGQTWRLWLAAMIAGVAMMMPAQKAQAMTAWDALDTVCSQAQDLCGPYDQAKGVIEGCFKGSDELKCAISIINVASGGGVSKAKGQVDAVLSCIKAGLPIGPTCDQYLSAAGISSAEINETYTIIKKCAAISDVDDAIVCADMLLDSQVAADAGLEVPSWVNSLFDIYMAIRDKDYWGLVYYVGATVACAVAEFFTGFDVCSLLGTLADVGGAVLDGVEAITEFLNDLFTDAGGTTFKVDGKVVSMVEFVSTLYQKAPANPGGAATSVAERLKGVDAIVKHRNDVIARAKIGQFSGTIKTAGGNDETYNAAWTAYTVRDMYPVWDAEIRNKVIPLRKQQIDAVIAKLPPDLADKLAANNNEAARSKIVKDALDACTFSSLFPTEQIKQWSSEGRGAAGERVTDSQATCSFRVAQLALSGTGPNACEPNLDPVKEVASAVCKSNQSNAACLSVQSALGSTRVISCTAKVDDKIGLRILVADDKVGNLGKVAVGNQCAGLATPIAKACMDSGANVAKAADNERKSRLVAGDSKPVGYGVSTNFDAMYRHDPAIKARADWMLNDKYDAAVADANKRVAFYTDRLENLRKSYQSVNGKYASLMSTWLAQCGPTIGRPGTPATPLCESLLSPAIAGCVTKGPTLAWDANSSTPNANAPVGNIGVGAGFGGGGGSSGFGGECSAEAKEALAQYAKRENVNPGADRQKTPLTGNIGGTPDPNKGAAAGLPPLPAATGAPASGLTPPPPPPPPSTPAAAPPRLGSPLPGMPAMPGMGGNVAADLARAGCKPAPIGGGYICTSKPGLDACEALRRANRVASCAVGR